MNKNLITGMVALFFMSNAFCVALVIGAQAEVDRFVKPDALEAKSGKERFLKILKSEIEDQKIVNPVLAKFFRYTAFAACLYGVYKNKYTYSRDVFCTNDFYNFPFGVYRKIPLITVALLAGLYGCRETIDDLSYEAASYVSFGKQNRLIQRIKDVKKAGVIREVDSKYLERWLKRFIEECIDAEVLQDIILFGPEFLERFSVIGLAVLDVDQWENFYKIFPDAVSKSKSITASIKLCEDKKQFAIQLKSFCNKLIIMSTNN